MAKTYNLRLEEETYFELNSAVHKIRKKTGIHKQTFVSNKSLGDAIVRYVLENYDINMRMDNYPQKIEFNRKNTNSK